MTFSRTGIHHGAPRNLLWAIVVFFIMTGTGASHAADFPLHLNYDRTMGVDIEIKAAFENSPPTGFLPLTIRIANSSGRPREYVLSTGGQNHYGGQDYQIDFERKLRVNDGETKVFNVLLPVPNVDDRGYYYPGMIALSGHSIPMGQFISLPSSSRGGGKARTGFMLVDTAITVVSWEPTRLELDKGGQELYGSAIRPEAIPADSLGLTGVNSIWLTAQGWLAMPPDRKEAVKEWLMLGGHLILAVPQTLAYSNEELDIPAPPAAGQFQIHRKWLGSVTVIPWDGASNLLLDSIRKPVLTGVLSNHQLNLQIVDGYRAEGHHPARWNLRMQMPDIQTAGALIMIFMLVFAIVVGPVNLFVFAKNPFRYRLFWTTPLISLVASVLLAALILIKDGVGAAGNALTLVYLPAGENRQAVIQEQCSLSGLLLNRRFTLDAPTFLASPLIDLSSRRNQRQMVIRDLKTYSGDWFASRSVDALLMQRIEPTRARVEIRNQPPFDKSRPPQIVSSIESPLSEIYFCDGQSNLWRAVHVAAGKVVTFEPATRAQFAAFMEEFNQKTGARIRSLTHEHFKEGVPNHFYARSGVTGKPLLSTLRSIRWKDAHVYYMGQMSGITFRSEPVTVEQSNVSENVPMDDSTENSVITPSPNPSIKAQP
ncbi:hypothetical protein QQ056_19660 [Oscillatoria laete-virens NRMC-F 0139]|nr:hypothetical protein [Oscillatoria laete-virens]MDL5055748.1 hypothetical protein [Oscillatoria laete-virens NRMC-F 0139]